MVNVKDFRKWESVSLERQGGVYVLFWDEASPWYIGETGASFESRLREHLGELRNGTHQNLAMLAFFAIYDEFPKMKIILSMPYSEPTERQRVEQSIIEELRQQGKILLNSEALRQGKKYHSDPGVSEERITFRLDSALREKLNQRTEELHVGTSCFLRHLIEEALKNPDPDSIE